VKIKINNLDIETILSHYNNIRILIEYIKQKNSEGDIGAYKALSDWDDARMVKPKKYQVDINAEFEVVEDTKIIFLDEGIDPDGSQPHFIKVPVTLDVKSIEEDLYRKYDEDKDYLEKIPTLREVLLSMGMEEIELDEYYG
jgi:hypothetical protein